MNLITFIILSTIFVGVIVFFIHIIFFGFVELFIAGNLFLLFLKNRKHFYVVVRSLQEFDGEYLFLKCNLYGHPVRCLIGIFSKKRRESLWVE